MSISARDLVVSSSTNSCSLPPKLEYSAPIEKPAASAISSTDAPAKPLRAKVRAAASSSSARVRALVSARVSLAT